MTPKDRAARSGWLRPSRPLDHSPCWAGPARASALRQQAPSIWPASGARKRRPRRKARSMEQETAHNEHAEVAVRGHTEAATRKEGTTMPNAVVMTGYGPPEVLKWAGVPLREPGEGQIRIKVKAAGISPTDLVLRAGYLKAIPLPPNAVLGFEAAGTVDAVGPGVTGTSLGDGVTALLFSLGVDAEFDAAGKGVLADAIALAGGPRRVITLADPAAADFGVTFSQYTSDRAPGALDETIALLAAGRLRLRAHTSMPMQQAAEAHRQLESGTVHERIILTLE